MEANICEIPHKIVECEDSFTADAAHFGQIDFKACEIIVDMTKESQEEIILREMESGSSSMIIWESCRYEDGKIIEVEE